nr:ileal sodium/bile acid cotransporter-like [Procambarus clarkii]
MSIMVSWACSLWACVVVGVVAGVGGSEEGVVEVVVQLEVDGREVEVLDLTDGDSVLVTFHLGAALPPPARYILIQEISPDAFGHVKVKPERVDVWYGETVLPVDGGVAGERGLTVDGGLIGTFNLTGTFLGFTKIHFSVVTGEGRTLFNSQQFTVKIQRRDKKLDKIFTALVITMVSIAYINMGCAIDINIIIESLKKPVAPAIGLASQYLFMPLVSYGLGYALFPESSALWLGLFVVGCSPGGGSSNLWTYLLGGSLDLSVTMTVVSTLVSFVALPAWVYALAATIFDEGNFERLPYGTMVGMVVGLLAPCMVGILIRRYMPKTAHFLKKLLTPIAVIFILVFSTFGVYVNLYIFYYFTWKVMLAGVALPGLGFIFGGLLAKMIGRPWQEVLAISIETGIQNSGLAIGVIKVALEKYSPLGDVTAVVPVGVATFTPLPLLLALLIKKVYGCCHHHPRPPGPPTCASTDNNDLKMTPATSQITLSIDPR